MPQAVIKSCNKRQRIWNLPFSQVTTASTVHTPPLQAETTTGLRWWRVGVFGACCLPISPVFMSGYHLPRTVAHVGRWAKMCSVLNSVFATAHGTQASKSQSYPKPSKEMRKVRLWAKGGHIKTLILRHSTVPCWE